MKRRDFITLLGGAAARGRWPRGRSSPSGCGAIGVLMSTAADDPEGQARIAAFLEGLQQLGWTVGRNAQIDIRWPTGDARPRKYAAELVALAPDVILATGVYAGSPLQQATRTVPIVFVLVVGSGRRWLRREPGAAGRQRHRIFTSEYSMSGKWLELLKQIAPA